MNSLFINGEKRSSAVTNISELLKELNLLPSQVAVEHNGTVLFRHELDQSFLKDGDRIEIVRVVAGG